MKKRKDEVNLCLGIESYLKFDILFFYLIINKKIQHFFSISPKHFEFFLFI